jgi:hypothetical protein
VIDARACTKRPTKRPELTARRHVSDCLLGYDTRRWSNRGDDLPHLGIDASLENDRGNILPSRARRDFDDHDPLTVFVNTRSPRADLNLRVRLGGLNTCTVCSFYVALHFPLTLCSVILFYNMLHMFPCISTLIHATLCYVLLHL